MFVLSSLVVLAVMAARLVHLLAHQSLTGQSAPFPLSVRSHS